MARIDSLRNSLIIDVRRPAEFEGGHITGSVNLWRDQVTDTSYSYGGMMATKNQIEELLSSLGATSTDTLILYDAKADVDAARLWWILKFYGHQNVRLLNGGLKCWTKIGGQLSTQKDSPAYAEFTFTSNADSSIHASIDQVREASESASSTLIDTRSVAEYSGEVLKNGAAWPGHIESAINIDWPTSVDYSGDHRFLDSDSLRLVYSELDREKPIITYCHSGVRSAHTLFVLTELLGYEDVRNYDGSWTEWSHLTQQN